MRGEEQRPGGGQMHAAEKRSGPCLIKQIARGRKMSIESWADIILTYCSELMLGGKEGVIFTFIKYDCLTELNEIWMQPEEKLTD